MAFELVDCCSRKHINNINPPCYIEKVETPIEQNTSLSGHILFCISILIIQYNPILNYKISISSPASALFILLIAQNFPHMEQVSSCSGFLSARIDFAVSGSIAHSHCASQSSVLLASAILSSISLAFLTPLAMSPA